MAGRRRHMPRLEAALIGFTLLSVNCLDIAPPANAWDPGRGDPELSQHVWTGASAIPDGEREGVLMGPVFTNDDGRPLAGIALRLDIRHPRTGDLDIWLAYDGDGDGNPETRAPVEFFRSRSDIRAEELHGCPQSLNGTYFFRDGIGREEQVFAQFRSLPRGHAFYLAVADTLPADMGTVMGWQVLIGDDNTLAMH
jgi:hypothetical protein